MNCSVCSIIPPHILRNIAERGDPAQREAAQATLEASAQIRGEASALGTMPALLAVGTGGKRRTVYDSGGRRKLPGTLVRGEGDAATHDLSADEAYDGAGRTYDFFESVFNRSSVDGHGLRLDSSVHFGRSFSNAQWNGRQMVYGDGDGRIFERFTKALEVIGHELTHGVTQYSAALAYHDQPGALNEHFSDVFGVLVKQHSLRQTAAQADWLIGAGLLSKKIHGVAVRSMKAPGTAYDDPLLGKDPQPSTMDSYQQMHSDNGGVHINSGIPNQVFYLVATLLGGRAWEVPGAIWYQTLIRGLHPESGFADCAAATFSIAGQLYGKGSEPQKAVREAWKRAGIRIAPAVAKEPRIPIRDQPSYAASYGAAEVPPEMPAEMQQVESDTRKRLRVRT